MRAFVCVILVLLLSLSVAALMPATSYKTPFNFERRYGVERVTHYDPRVNYPRVDATVYLSAPGPVDYKGAGRGGYAPLYARGTAKVQSSTWFGYPRSEVNIVTKDIPPSYENNMAYEAWLVDADTGYRLSLGTFTTMFGGVGDLWFRIDNYLGPYEWVEITAEPLVDADVYPGPVVLLGRIPQPNYFNPPPKSSKMVTDTVKEY